MTRKTGIATRAVSRWADRTHEPNRFAVKRFESPDNDRSRQIPCRKAKCLRTDGVTDRVPICWRGDSVDREKGGRSRDAVLIQSQWLDGVAGRLCDSRHLGREPTESRVFRGGRLATDDFKASPLAAGEKVDENGLDRVISV